MSKILEKYFPIICIILYFKILSREYKGTSNISQKWTDKGEVFDILKSLVKLFLSSFT